MLGLERCCPFFFSNSNANQAFIQKAVEPSSEINGEQLVVKLIHGKTNQVFTKLFEGIKFSKVTGNKWEADVAEPYLIEEDKPDRTVFEIGGKVVVRLEHQAVCTHLVFESGLKFSHKLTTGSVRKLLISGFHFGVQYDKYTKFMDLSELKNFKKIQHLKSS